MPVQGRAGITRRLPGRIAIPVPARATAIRRLRLPPRWLFQPFSMAISTVLGALQSPIAYSCPSAPSADRQPASVELARQPSQSTIKSIDRRVLMRSLKISRSSTQSPSACLCKQFADAGPGCFYPHPNPLPGEREKNVRPTDAGASQPRCPSSDEPEVIASVILSAYF